MSKAIFLAVLYVTGPDRSLTSVTPLAGTTDGEWINETKSSDKIALGLDLLGRGQLCHLRKHGRRQAS